MTIHISVSVEQPDTDAGDCTFYITGTGFPPPNPGEHIYISITFSTNGGTSSNYMDFASDLHARRWNSVWLDSDGVFRDHLGGLIHWAEDGSISGVCVGGELGAPDGDGWFSSGQVFDEPLVVVGDELRYRIGTIEEYITYNLADNVTESVVVDGPAPLGLTGLVPIDLVPTGNPPENDDYANAIEFTVEDSPILEAPNQDATYSYDDDFMDDSPRSLWWKFTPASSVHVTFDSSLSTSHYTGGEMPMWVRIKPAAGGPGYFNELDVTGGTEYIVYAAPRDYENFGDVRIAAFVGVQVSPVDLSLQTIPTMDPPLITPAEIDLVPLDPSLPTPVHGSGSLAFTGAALSVLGTPAAASGGLVFAGVQTPAVDGIIYATAIGSLGLDAVSSADPIPIGATGGGSMSFTGSGTALVLADPEDDPVIPDPDGDGVRRWTFYDPVTTGTFTLPRNPSKASSPKVDKRISFDVTTGDGGHAIASEGAMAPRTFSFSGVLLDEDELDEMRDWTSRRGLIRITDDLGRAYGVRFKSASFSRRRMASVPVLHDYSVEVEVIR